MNLEGRQIESRVRYDQGRIGGGRRGGGGCWAIFIRTCHFLSSLSKTPLKKTPVQCAGCRRRDRFTWSWISTSDQEQRASWGEDVSVDVLSYLPPKSCIPSRANTTIKRKRRKSRLMMDFMELMRDTTKFLREAQYLAERSHSVCKQNIRLLHNWRSVELKPFCFPTYFVILKILSSLSALRTLMPNDMPGRKKPQTTSKMLPTITCGTSDSRWKSRDKSEIQAHKVTYFSEM